MRKIACLVLLAVALIGCGGDTETSVLASPASTAKYDALGVALVAAGGTFDMTTAGPIKIMDGGTAFVLRWEIGAREFIYDPTRNPDPYKGEWTVAEKAKFTELYDSVHLTR